MPWEVCARSGRHTEGEEIKVHISLTRGLNIMYLQKDWNLGTFRALFLDFKGFLWNTKQKKEKRKKKKE
jgi:hypothetical protein